MMKKPLDHLHAWLGVLLFLAFTVLACCDAHALTTMSPTGGASVNFVSGGVQIGDGTGAGYVGRTFTTPATGTGATVAENYAVRVGGQEIAVTAARTATAAEVGVAAAAVAAAGYAGLQIGGAISHAMGNDTVTIGATRCTASYGGWKCDEGQAAQLVEGWEYACSTGACVNVWTTASGACQAMALQYDHSGAYPGSLSGSAPAYGCLIDGNVWGLSRQSSQQLKCPASIDALNPAWSVPDGGSPDPDGKCKTGRYEPATQPYVANRIATQVAPEKLKDVAQATLEAGQPIEVAAPRSLSGPASKVGAPTTTTTTNPDGSTKTTTTTPTNYYHYDGDTVTYNTQVVTTVNNNGDTTTTTTTTDGTAPDPEDRCTKHPETMGCAKFGDLPTDSPNWETKTVTFTAEDLGIAGACPAPQTIHLAYLNKDLVWSYQAACDVAPTVRLTMLVLTITGCLLWILSTVKQ